MNDHANTIGEAFAGFAADLAILIAAGCITYGLFVLYLKATGQKLDQ
jgi:hypothetical protein